MYAAGVLLLLTLVSMYLVSGLYAKYISADGASDSATVATFYLKADGSLLHLINTDIFPGEEQDETLQIVNKSEVSMRYTLTIKNETGNLPLSVVLKKNGTTEEYPLSSGKIELTKIIAPGNMTDEYDLEIRWPVDENNPDSNLAYMGMLDYFTVTVDVVQVD